MPGFPADAAAVYAMDQPGELFCTNRITLAGSSYDGCGALAVLAVTYRSGEMLVRDIKA